MKYIKKMLVFTILMIVGFGVVNAVTMPVTGTLTINGNNSVTNTLTLSLNSSVAGAYLKNIQWYYNESNSTSGGTAISGATSTSLYLTNDYAGKYIYATATISTNSPVAGYEMQDTQVSDITDASNNGTATVQGSNTNPGNPGTNPGTNPEENTSQDYITTISTNPGYSIAAEATYESGSALTLTLNGITNTTNVSYYVFFSNSNTPPTLKTNSHGCDMSDNNKNDLLKFKTVLSNNHIHIANDWYMIKGYTKAYVVKETIGNDAHHYCELLTTPINVEKPAVRSLGSRYQIYLFDKTSTTDDFTNTISIFPYFPYSGTNGSHKIQVKIGIINDKSLLKKLAKKTSDSLTLLLEYAKNHEGRELQFNDDDLYKKSLGTFDVVNGAYYFIYTGYLNTDDTYRDLDDVSVVMGKNNMLVTDVKWENFNEEPTDSEEEPTDVEEEQPIDNPSTGINSYIIATITVLLFSGLAFFVIKRKSVFKKL